MKENMDEVLLEGNDEGVQKVKDQDYAFLMESSSIEYMIERECKITQVGGLLDEKGYGIAMKKCEPHTNTPTAALHCHDMQCVTLLSYVIASFSSSQLCERSRMCIKMYSDIAMQVARLPIVARERRPDVRETEIHISTHSDRFDIKTKYRCCRLALSTLLEQSRSAVIRKWNDNRAEKEVVDAKERRRQMSGKRRLKARSRYYKMQIAHQSRLLIRPFVRRFVGGRRN